MMGVFERFQFVDITKYHPELIRMAIELREYCQKHHIPGSLLINGVAWDAEAFLASQAHRVRERNSNT